jgi:arylsulfatase A-like enzyme
MDVHEYAAPNEFKRFGSDARGAYAASILWVDDGLRRVRLLLEANGFLDDTIVVVASDHGETFGENGRTGHARNVLSAVLHVPLVIRLPFAVAPIRVPGQVRMIDLAPTLLELAGVPVPADFEGTSLLPAARTAGSAPEGDRTNFAALGTKLYPDATAQVSATDRSWTFARNLDGASGELLFDRSIDPNENVNLIAREAAEAARWRERLDAHLAPDPRAQVRESGVRIDPEIERRLRAMGYLR